MAREYTVKINVQSEKATQQIEQFSAKALANIEKINKVEIKPKTTTKDVEVSLNRLQEASVRAATAETNRAAAADRAAATTARAHATEASALEKTKQKELDLEKATVQANARMEVQRMRLEQGQNAMHSFANATQNAVNQLKMLVGYAGATQMLRSALTEMKAMSDELVTYQKVTNATAEQMKQVRASAYESAKQYGQAPSDYLESVARMARAGYGQQAEAMANLATKTQLVGDMSAEMASKFLIAVDAGYQLNGSIAELEKVLNAANVADNNYATSLEQIAEGMTLIAPLAASMNISVQETTAAIGTMQALTQRSGTEVARAFRMIAINIAKDTETEVEEGFKLTQENVEDFNALLQEFAKEELKAAEAGGKLLSPMKAIEAIAKAWKSGKLSEQQLFSVLNDIGGARYTNSIMALVKNFDVYQEMLGKFSTELTSADDEVSAMMDSWSRKLEVLKTSWVEMVNNRVSEDFIKSLLDMGTGFLQWTGNLENFITVGVGAIAVIKQMWTLLTAGPAAMNPVVLAIGAVATAFGIAKTAIDNHRKALQDSSNAAAESASKAYDQAKAINELVAAYNALAADGTIDDTELDEAKRIQEEINKLVDDLPEKYDLVNGSIESNVASLKKLNQEQLKAAKISAQEAVNTSGNAMVEYGKQLGIFTGLNTNWHGNGSQRRTAQRFINSELANSNLFRFMLGGQGEADSIAYIGAKTAEEVLNGYDELSKIISDATEQGLDKTASDLYYALIATRDNMQSVVENYRSAVDYNNLIQKEDFSRESGAETGTGSGTGTASGADNAKEGAKAVDGYAESYNRLQAAIAAATTAQEKFNAETSTTKGDQLKFYGSALEAYNEELKAGRVNSSAFHAAARALMGDEAYNATGGYTQNVQAAMNATGSKGISLIDAITTLTAEYKNQAGEVREGAGLAVLLEKLGYNVKDSQGNYVVKMTEDMYKEVMAAIPGLTREMLENAANAYDQYDVKGRNTNLAPKEKELTEEQQNAQTNKEAAEGQQTAAETQQTAADAQKEAAEAQKEAAQEQKEAANKTAEAGDKPEGSGNKGNDIPSAATATGINPNTRDTIYHKTGDDNAIAVIQAERADLESESAAKFGYTTWFEKAFESAKAAKQTAAENAADAIENWKAQNRLRASAVTASYDPRSAGGYTQAEIDWANKEKEKKDAIDKANQSIEELANIQRAFAEQEAAAREAEMDASMRKKEQDAAKAAAEKAAKSAENIPAAATVTGIDQYTKNPIYHKNGNDIDTQRGEELRKESAREVATEAAEEAFKYYNYRSEKNWADDKIVAAQAAKDREKREEKNRKTESEKQDEKAAAEENNKRIGELTDTVNEIGQNIQGQAESTEKAATVITDSGMLEYYKRMRSIAQNGGKAQSENQQFSYDNFIKGIGKANDKPEDVVSWLNTKIDGLETQVNVGMGETPEIEYNDIEIVADIKAKLDEYTVDEAVAALDLIDERVKPAYIEAVLDKYSLGEVLSALKYTTDENRVAVIKAAVDKFGIDQVKAEFAKLTDEDQTVYIKALVAQGEYQLAASLLSGLAKSKSAAIIAQLDQNSANRVNAELNALAGTRTSVIQVVEQKASSTVSQAKDAFSSASSPWDAVGGVVSTLTGKKKAVGTTRHPGGPAIVNDGTGAELYIDSSGAHVANGGREAIINLEKGAKVYTAEQTRRMLGKIPQFENSSTPDQGRVQELADWVNSYFDTISTNDTQYTASGSNKGSDKGSGKSGTNKSSATVTNSGGSGSAAEAEDKRWDELKSLIEYILKRLNKALEKQESIIDKQIEELQARKSQSEQENKLEELQKAVSEAQANLQEAMNQRSVRYLDDNGQWHWMADQKKVEQAKKELDESQKSLQDYLNDLFVDAQIQALENEKKRLSEEYSEYTDLWSDILDAVDTPTGELVALISSLTATGTGAQKNGAAAVRNLLISALQGGSYKSNYTEALGEIAKATANNPSVPGVSDEYLAGLIASSGTRISHSAMYDALQSIAGGGTLAAGSAAMETTNHQDTYYMINGVQIGSDMAELPMSEVLRRLSIMTNI